MTTVQTLVAVIGSFLASVTLMRWFRLGVLALNKRRIIKQEKKNREIDRLFDSNLKCMEYIADLQKRVDSLEDQKGDNQC